MINSVVVQINSYNLAVIKDPPMKLYQAQTHHSRHTLGLTVMFLLAVSLCVGCGQSAGEPNMLPASTAVPTAPPLPTSTLSRPEIDATKNAQFMERQRVVDEHSTRTAMGTPWVFTP